MNDIGRLQSRLSGIPAEKLAFKNLAAYIALQNVNYQFARHVTETVSALMAVERGDIQRLIVNMPPRHGKTHLISEYFPAWFMGRNPTKQVIFATYSHERSGDVGRKVRNQLIDPTFKLIFPGISIAKDHSGMNRVATDQGGNFYAVGVGGAITGRGAHLFVIDDPTKGREEAESEIQREKLVDWFRSVAYTRLMPGNAIICVQTRWHYDDLTGFLINDLKHENWHIINFPAIAEASGDVLGREPGDALWPDRYPLDKLYQIRETIGTREWNSQYQQNPLPSEGGMIKLDWFKHYKYRDFKAQLNLIDKAIADNEPPPPLPLGIKKFVCSWDTAFKEKQLNDPSACTVWGIGSDNNFYLVDVINLRLGYPELKREAIAVQSEYSRYAPNVMVIIEDRGSGQSLIQDLKIGTRIPVIASQPENNKQIRLDAVAPMIEAGRVFLPDQAPWLVPYETELTRFPLWRTDDLVDSTSQFLKWAGAPQFIRNKRRRFWK